MFQVVFFFETVPDDSSNGCPASLSQSVTLDSIHAGANSKQEFTGRYAQTHRYPNIEKLTVPPSINKTGHSDSVSDNYGKMSISGNDNKGGAFNIARGVGTGVCYTDGPCMAGESESAHRRQIPPSSQSYPDQLSNRPTHAMKSNRQAYIEPSGGARRAQTLLQVESDSSLVSMENASVGEPEDNFSDSDTDNEWEGCEVTVV